MNAKFNRVSNQFPQISDLLGVRFSRALEFSPLPVETLQLLSRPQKVTNILIPVKMDNGTTDFFPSWRLNFANPFGPSKGGVRFHRGVDQASLEILAARILVKCALHSLPHGGAAGGVAVDPKLLSIGEMERLARAYATAYADLVGSDKDILSPDLGTDALVMGWMADQLSLIQRRFDQGAVNGKPVGLGGVPGRRMATAAGALAVLKVVCPELGVDPLKAAFAIQGFGAAGATLAALLTDGGASVVAVTDTSGGWYAPAGLDIVALQSHKLQGGELASANVEGAARISSEAVLEVPADVVVAAACGGAIGTANATRLRCKMVVEIANAAVSSDAEEILESRAIPVIPDIVVNAGGITVSHFEWTQGRSGMQLGRGGCDGPAGAAYARYG